MVLLKIDPEQPDEIAGQFGEAVVVQRGLAFTQVVDEKVPDGAALHLVTVDEFLDRPLAGRLEEGPAGGRCAGSQMSQGVQQPVGQKPAGAAGPGVAHRIEQVEVVTHGNVADQAALAGQDHGDAGERQAPPGSRQAAIAVTIQLEARRTIQGSAGRTTSAQTSMSRPVW